jgi:transcription elongation factor/antiterminator RfaH
MVKQEGDTQGESQMVRWYVVHTLPHRERGANHQLLNQGFTSFLPKRLKTRRHARKIETVKAPLFPRYLFVKLDMTRDRWRSVNGTFGVASLIMEGEQPKAVPLGVVESLAAQADSDGVLRFDMVDRLSVGQQVEVLAGPFSESIGVIDRLDDAGRVRVLLDIMGGRIPVELDSMSVMPA